MAEFNLRMQKYYDGSVLGLRLHMLNFWMSYQIRRTKESYFPAYKRCNNKKPSLVVVWELLKLAIHWKSLPFHYIRYSLYDKEYPYEKVLDYLPETNFYYDIQPRINKRYFLLDDKIIFEEYLKGKNIAFPKTVLKTKNNVLFNNESQVINGDQALDIVNKSTSNTIFFKPSSFGSGGYGIYSATRKEGVFIDDQGKEIDARYLEELKKNEWIVQEKVENSKSIAEIYNFCTNSFRVLTFFIPGVGAKVLYCILKFGNNKAITDNAHTGGVYVRVDTETGELFDTAYDENLYQYKEHPYTKKPFKGERVDDIKKVVKMAEDLGNMFPDLTFVGWDIVLSPVGPVVLEGNSSPGLTIIQRTYTGMKEFYDLYLKHFKNVQK